MSTMTHDDPQVTARVRLLEGLGFAVLSATSFGLAGAVARPLLDAGWSAGATVLVRVGLAAVVVTPFAVAALRGRWSLVRRNARLIALYGVLAVAGAQFCYFSAVRYMQVGPALLIEYTAPVAVVVWMWLRHDQRPGRVTVTGAGLAALGLVLVLDLFSGADLSVVGIAWALGAMVGASTHFIVSADLENGLPPIVLAAGGLLVGSVTLGALGLVGLLPMHATTDAVEYAGRTVSWWAPLVVLGVVTAAVSYTSGIAAGRRLGSRLASFVGLLEVVSAVVFAWLLLGELPRTVQLVGGLLILAGVVVVKLGEQDTAGSAAVPAPTVGPAA